MHYHQVSGGGVIICALDQEETGCGKFNTKGFILVLRLNLYGSNPTKLNKGNSRITDSFIWNKIR